MARHKDADWKLSESITTWTEAQAAILMDIRDELRAINGKLSCYRIPVALDTIIRFGRKKRRQKRKR